MTTATSGHARCYLAFDVIQRWLRYRGYPGAPTCATSPTSTTRSSGVPPSAASRTSALTERFIAAMHEDFAAIGLEPPTHEPRATAVHLPPMIAMIERLIAARLRLRRRPGRCALCGREVSRLRAACRASVWRTCAPVRASRSTRASAIRWISCSGSGPSPASRPGVRPGDAGRPGWHIECSAMASELLGTHFDLHGGGEDLKFPHHENEIAQSVAANGPPFVNVWVHNGFVNIDDEKMSKSLRQLLHRPRELLPYLRHPEVLRGLLLMSHYRGPINYSPAQLLQADAALTRLYTALRGLPKSRSMRRGRGVGGRRQCGRRTRVRCSSRRRWMMISTRPRHSRCCRDWRASSTPRAHVCAGRQGAGRQARHVQELAASCASWRACSGCCACLPRSGSGSPRRARSRARAAPRMARSASPRREIEALIEARRAARAARDFAGGRSHPRAAARGGRRARGSAGRSHDLEARDVSTARWSRPMVSAARDVMLIPCWRRPEFLWHCLDNLARAEGSSSCTCCSAPIPASIRRSWR